MSSRISQTDREPSLFPVQDKSPSHLAQFWLYDNQALISHYKFIDLRVKKERTSEGASQQEMDPTIQLTESKTNTKESFSHQAFSFTAKEVRRLGHQISSGNWVHSKLHKDGRNKQAALPTSEVREMKSGNRHLSFISSDTGPFHWLYQVIWKPSHPLFNREPFSFYKWRT